MDFSNIWDAIFPCMVRTQSWMPAADGGRKNIQEGSGIIVGDGRYLLTCRHNIGKNVAFAIFESGKEEAAVLQNPRPYPSDVADLALVEADNVLGKPAVVAANGVVPGDEVVLAGFPLRWHHLAATVGNVSGYSDASFTLSIANTTGFSGGGVFNSAGRLVGMMVANHPILEERTMADAIRDRPSEEFLAEHPSVERILEQLIVGVPVGLAYPLLMADIRKLLGAKSHVLGGSSD